MCYCLKKKNGQQNVNYHKKDTKHYPMIWRTRVLLHLVHCVQFKLLHLKKNVIDLEKIQKG